MVDANERATLFLSYARADEASARRLALALENAGYIVWWDALIEGGAAFAKSIAQALDAADAVLVLWSKHSVDSDWVKDEAAQGRDRHRLIPTTIDGAQPPLGFRQYQVIDLSRWNGRRTATQFAAVERAIASALGHASTGETSSRTPISRRALVASGGIGAIAIAGGGAWFAWDRDFFAEHASLSIAVLPFRNLTNDSSQEYFSDGLTDEVRSALTRISELMVLAATSSEKASGGNGNPKSIANKLGVGYLLSGSVQREADVVRITLDLINGRTGFSRWADTFDRKLTDIFAVQSEIARIVARVMSVEVATSRPAPGGTRNVGAYEQFLQGRALFNLAKDENSDRDALSHYELAIATDPNFALAHAGRSRTLAVIAAEYAAADQLKPLYDQAIASATRAVELAPDLAEGHLALGYAKFAGRLDVAGARPSYDRAYKLGFGNGDIVLLYALYVVRARRFGQAQKAIARSLSLDPLNPRAHRAAGTIAYASRRYREAIAQYDKAIELNPKISNARALKGDCLMEVGQLAEARATYAEESNALFRNRGQAILEHRAGNKEAAQRAFDQLVSQQGDAATYQQAEVMAQWGRADDALRLLERARAIGDSGLSYIATDPLLDPLSKDPRFTRFIRDIGFA